MHDSFWVGDSSLLNSQDFVDGGGGPISRRPSHPSDPDTILGFLVYQTFSVARDKTSKATKEESKDDPKAPEPDSQEDNAEGQSEDKNMENLKKTFGDAANSLTRAVQVQSIEMRLNVTK